MADSSLQLIDVFPEPCLLLSPEGVIVRANTAFLRLLNLKRGSIAGKDICTLSSTEPNSLRNFLKLCSKNCNFVMGSIAFSLAEGEQNFRCEGAAVAVTDLHKASLILLRFKPRHRAVEQFTLLNGKINELTSEVRQRVIVEKALRQSESLFRGLADSMPQIVWAAQPDGTTDYFNLQWYELTGAKKDAGFSDENWIMFLHPDDQQRCLKLWCDCVRTGQNYQIEYRLKFASDNKYHWHLGRSVPVRDIQGNIIRWFGTCTDIDDQKLAAEKLEFAVAERTASLRSAIAQLEEFSYSVSHDLRAPVRAMHGYAQALLQDHADQLDGEAKDYLQRIVRAGTRMDKLIMDVLTFSQVARDQVQLQPVFLGRLVQEVIEQYPELQSPRAEISVGPLPCVLAHEPSLSQVISNLLINAVKFVPEGVTPRVTIRSEAKTSQVRIWIEDNGIGIEPEYHERVFGLFERVHPENKYVGTGVGLAIVKKALERMGGTVGIESDGVNGCKFWIELKATKS